MATAGQTFENPVTGEKMVFVKTGRETNGMVLEIEFFIQPNSGKGLSAHVHPWNVGDDVLHVRKITQLNKPDMQLLLASATFFESLYALAQQGKVGKDGLPKDLLQTIVLLQALEPSAYVAGIPIWIQRPLFGLLAAVGRALGYKASYNAQPA